MHKILKSSMKINSKLTIVRWWVYIKLSVIYCNIYFYQFLVIKNIGKWFLSVERLCNFTGMKMHPTLLNIPRFIFQLFVIVININNSFIFTSTYIITVPWTNKHVVWRTLSVISNELPFKDGPS